MTTATATGNGHALLAEDAQLTTVSVQVLAVRIGSKQMTQSVFKQLHSESLLDVETNSVLGTPWGTVNFHPGCDPAAAEHLHVIWQKGNVLRRDRVFRNVTHDRRANERESLLKANYSSAAWKVVIATLLAGATFSEPDCEVVSLVDEGRTFRWEKPLEFWAVQRGANNPPEKNFHFKREFGRDILQRFDIPQHDQLPAPFDNMDFQARYKEVERSWREDRWPELVGRCRAELGRQIDTATWVGATAAQLRDRHLPVHRRHYREFVDWWAARYDALAAMDQLFIAV